LKYNRCLHITDSLTTAWCIWMERNNVLFKGKVANDLEVVDRIKHLCGLGSYGEGRNKKFASRIGCWTLLYVFKICNFLTYCNGLRVPLILDLIKSCLYNFFYCFIDLYWCYYQMHSISLWYISFEIEIRKPELGGKITR